MAGLFVFLLSNNYISWEEIKTTKEDIKKIIDRLPDSMRFKESADIKEKTKIKNKKESKQNDK